MMRAPVMIGVLMLASVAVGAGAPPGRAQSPAGKAGRTAGRAADGVQTGISDASITARTMIELCADERVKGRQISVETMQGTVTLRGQVDSSEARAIATAIATEIGGAKRLRNDLRVAPTRDGPAAAVPDKDITRYVEARLSQEAQLKKVEVRTDGGTVFLTGTVPSLAASARASELTRSVPSARAIKNQLTYGVAAGAARPSRSQ